MHGGSSRGGSAPSRLRAYLSALYGETRAQGLAERLLEAADALRARRPEPTRRPARAPVICVYPDHVSADDAPPLETLRQVLAESLGDTLGEVCVHVLPPYVADGDDGFAVVDHRAVQPRLGSWEDLRTLAREAGGLMLDLVVNHISTTHPRFQALLRGEGAPEDFHLFEGPREITWGTRTRTSAVVQRFTGTRGPLFAWCTYGRGQVDLDYRSPAVLEETARDLLALLAAGASEVRLDAIPHAWKRLPGGPHQPEVKLLVGALRAVADRVDPSVRLMAETDHAGGDRCYLGEALAQRDNHLVTPPLLLAAVIAGAPEPLVDWVNSVAADPGRDQGYAFLMTHDGIHLRPMAPPLDAQTDAALHARLSERGVVATRALVQGVPRPYELNSALHRIFTGPSGFDLQRYLCAQALLFALPGTPSLYFPTLFALPEAGPVDPTHPRGANRRRYRLEELRERVSHPAAKQVNARIRQLIHLRAGHPAFDEGAPCSARVLGPGVLQVSRGEGASALHVIANVGEAGANLTPPLAAWRDLLSGATGRGALSLAPGEARWLAAPGEELHP